MTTTAATFLSRLLGMVRDIAIADLLGAGLSADVFFFANRIPNFFRRLFAEGAFSQAFVPVFTRTKKEASPAELRDLLRAALGTLGGTVLIVSVAGMVIAPVLTALFGWGWFRAYLLGTPDGEKFVTASRLLSITFPYLFFITLTALSSAVLNVFGRFGVPALTPCLLNLTLIAMIYGCADLWENPNTMLAWGMVIGGAAQLAFQLPFLLRLRLLVRPRWGWHHPGVRRIRRLMLPAVIGVSAGQLNLFVNTMLASFLATGAISYLYYADRLLEFPIGMFAVAISVVILPALSGLDGRREPARYRETLDWGLRAVLFLGLPSMAGIIALREPMLRVLFMRGAFTAAHVEAAAAALLASVSGLAAIMTVRVLVQGFAACQDTATPVKCSLAAIGTNIVCNLALVAPLGYVGLALSGAIAAYVNAGLLFFLLHRRRLYRPSRPTAVFVLRIGAAAGGESARRPTPIRVAAAWTGCDTLTAAWRLGGLIALGAAGYAAVAVLLGLRPRELRM